jgi:hypothetical protein
MSPTKPAQHAPKLFLSYASEDVEPVTFLYESLRRAGCEPWMDRRDILPGEDWSRCIWRAIHNADFIIVCLSPRSVSKRGYVQREIKEALDLWKERLEDDIFVVPVKLVECAVPDALARFQWVEMFQSDGLERVLRAIQRSFSTVGSQIEDLDASGFETESITEADPDQLVYTLSIEYPQFRPRADASLSEINARIRGYIGKMELRFRKESLACLEMQDERDRRHSTAWLRDELKVSFAVHLLTEDLVSIEFSLMTYGAGAVHPNSHTRTFNFRRKPTLELDLTDVVDPLSDYLQTFSQHCISELGKQRDAEPGSVPFDENWLSQGAGPVHRNFENWLFVARGIRVVFDPYQVDCYAAGRHEVNVPIAILGSVLKAEYFNLLRGTVNESERQASGRERLK